MTLHNFNFTSANPRPTSADFYFTLGALLYQIYTDDNYIYTATAEQLNIYDDVSESLYAYIPYTNGFTTVAGNETYIYLGTTNSGIKRVSKNCISGSILSPYDLSACLIDYVTYPSIEGNDIQYLHANDYFMGIISNSGIAVSVAKFDPQSYMSKTTLSNLKAKKCFVTSTGGLYYTSSGTNGWRIDVVRTSLCDWSLSDYSYITGSGILKTGLTINDIFVTEQTSDNFNTLFVATSSGLYIINENSGAFNIYLEE